MFMLMFPTVLKAINEWDNQFRGIFGPFRGGSRISGTGRGIICIKGWGFASLILSHFS